MQFFLANLHAERLSGSADASVGTGTSTKIDSATEIDSAPVSAVTDQARQAESVPVLSGSR